MWSQTTWTSGINLCKTVEYERFRWFLSVQFLFFSSLFVNAISRWLLLVYNTGFKYCFSKDLEVTGAISMQVKFRPRPLFRIMTTSLELERPRAWIDGVRPGIASRRRYQCAVPLLRCMWKSWMWKTSYNLRPNWWQTLACGLDLYFYTSEDMMAFHILINNIYNTCVCVEFSWVMGKEILGYERGGVVKKSYTFGSEMIVL